jgi:signal transduction histidine kinase
VVARSEAGKLVMADETVDLGAEVDRVAKLLGVALTIHGAVGLARGDSARVRQIVRNLIVNAQRYGGERIEAYLGGEEGQAALAIVDNGHGIPVEARHRMFQPFERAGRVEGSTGLGLWLSRRLAERMGGSLEYERTDDLSRFTLRLAAVAD